MVLSLIAILMGISIGAFRRSIPVRDLARTAMSEALRQARLFAIAESSPASVRLVPGDEAAALLDQAEDIVNAAAPELLAEVRRDETPPERPRRSRWWRRGR